MFINLNCLDVQITCFCNNCVHHQDGEDEAFKDLAEEKENGDVDHDDDEEERFVDADKLEEGAAVDEGGGAKEEGGRAQPRPAASWVHHQNLEGQFSVLVVHGRHVALPLFLLSPPVLPVGHQGARASRATTHCTETRCSAALTAQHCGSCSRCYIHSAVKSIIVS